MRRLLYISIALIVTIVAINVFFMRSVYYQQVEYQKNIIYQQVQACGSAIEDKGLKFQNDINYIAFYSDVANIFKNEEIFNSGLRKLELFYSSFDEIINNIYVYDLENNVLSLYKDRKKKFITDRYISKRQKKLYNREKIIIKKGKCNYYLPVFNNNKVVSNVVVTVNIYDYIAKSLESYYLPESQWQWLVNSKAEILINNFEADTVKPSQMDIIQQNLNQDFEGFLQHEMLMDNKSVKVLSAYYPFTFFTNKFGLIFTLNTNIILRLIFEKAIIINLISFGILILAIVLILMLLKKEQKKTEVLKTDIKLLDIIIQNIPIGIILLDKDKKIKRINHEACHLLSVKEDEDLVGEVISERFRLFENYISSSDPKAVFDTDRFVYFEKGGNELILYKKETVVNIDGEDIWVEVLMDVTSVEKSRKYEAASNNAKSDFLAKMSHEIRTPMNGIIGMVEALEKEKPAAGQSEKLIVIRKSADMLMSLINDLLDISKIEAGKMQLEEIPFNLRDEIDLCVELFEAVADEKGLRIKKEIDKQVPNLLIGDPFRLRQVITNLISNAVKFTNEGRVVVECKLDEKYGPNVSLIFAVHDTGVGIDEDKINAIFNSFTQGSDATSREFGGTGLGTAISKQLVDLMNGEIWVESPSKISTSKKLPGASFYFSIETFSNEAINKGLNYSGIKQFNEINTLVITSHIKKIRRFRSFLEKIKINYSVYETKQIDKQEISKLIKNNTWHKIVLVDDHELNAFDVVNVFSEMDYMQQALFIILSANHKTGNYIKAKKSQVDYYLLQPFETKDFTNIIYDNFKALEHTKDYLTESINKNLAVLVAEDNVLNQKVAQTIFNELNIKIDIAEDGDMAIKKIKENTYDIIFLDINMPGKDGFEVTRETRKMGYELPIVAMTATIDKEIKQKAIASGMNDYVTKPVKAEGIGNILKKWYM